MQLGLQFPGVQAAPAVQPMHAVPCAARMLACWGAMCKAHVQFAQHHTFDVCGGVLEGAVGVIQ
jgi:hypothetical protein